jgi:hypothetical protein
MPHVYTPDDTTLPLLIIAVSLWGAVVLWRRYNASA